jgi:DDE superfamily endonuclease
MWRRSSTILKRWRRSSGSGRREAVAPLSPRQKPTRRVYEQRPDAVKKWLDEEYPAIAWRAKSEGGEIHWGDETALVNSDVRGRGYAPKGQTPVAYAPGSRQELSMISTVTNKGKARWMIVDDVFNADRLIEFFEALTKDALNKIFLILTTCASIIPRWSRPGSPITAIEVFYLPSYAPELNPDERLDADLKQAIGAKVAVRTKAKLKSAGEAHMAAIEKSKRRVKAYFRDPNVRYAA